MQHKRIAIRSGDVEPRSASSYPEPFRSRVLPRAKRAIGDALGLTKIGVNVTTLSPGKESSMRHHHTLEDELIYVLEGELTLITDYGEESMTAGMCAGFPAGDRNAHHFVNRTKSDVRYIEISNRDPEDSAEYPDVDLAYKKGEKGTAIFTKKDGTSY